MNVVWFHIIATLLTLVGLALIVAGLGGTDLVWQAGLAAIGVAMLFSFATRWAPTRDDDEDDVSREEL